MDGRGVAWIGYIPVPGLSFVPVLLRPDDRLTRYHAWQSGMLVIGLWFLLGLTGFFLRVSEAEAFRSIVGVIISLVLLVGLVQLGWGAVQAARGAYPRLRPAWDLAAMVRR